MADPTFRALATAAYSTANPHVAAKPAGLTAGDLMVLYVCGTDGAPSGTPSGWTEKSTSPAGTQYNWTTIYTKIATAADVAASSFSVPNANSKGLRSATYAFSDASDDLAIVGNVYLAYGYIATTFSGDVTPPDNSVIVWSGWSGQTITTVYVNTQGQTATTDLDTSDGNKLTLKRMAWSGQITELKAYFKAAIYGTATSIVIVGASAASSRIFVPDLQGGLDTNLTGGI